MTGVREVLRQLRPGETERRIERDFGRSRNAVAGDRHWFQTSRLRILEES